MTDVATKPGDVVAPEAQPSPPLAPSSPEVAPEEFAWSTAPVEERRRPRARWIVGGVTAGAGVIALVAASLVLIAPGTSASAVPVGFLTPGAATDAVQARLDETTVTIDGQTLGARELGFSVDAAAAADDAFAAHPMWNPSTWFQAPTAAEISVDADVADAELEGIVPDAFVAPVDAAVVFDAATASYTVTPAVDGRAVDLEALRVAVQRAFDAGETAVVADASPVVVAAAADTGEANEVAGNLNATLATVGFYVGTERTVPIDRATAASWLTIEPDTAAGGFTVTADRAKIQAAIDTLPALVDRPVVNATTITNSAGEALSDMTAGVNGRTLGDTSGLARDVASQLSAGEGGGAFELPVTEVPFTTTTLYRHIEVNLSEQQAYLFENDQVVDSWPISSGREGFSSSTGNFTINSKLTSQNMGNRDLDQAPYYFTPDVPWVMYYNGDEALHGAYWHNNFGNVMSHGCINMPVDAAAFAYSWAPIGTEVWVHY